MTSMPGHNIPVLPFRTEQLRLRLGDDIGPHQEGELKQWSISGLAKQTFFCFLSWIALYNFLPEKNF